jgi:hypothetical protein
VVRLASTPARAGPDEIDTGTDAVSENDMIPAE